MIYTIIELIAFGGLAFHVFWQGRQLGALRATVDGPLYEYFSKLSDRTDHHHDALAQHAQVITDHINGKIEDDS